MNPSRIEIKLNKCFNVLAFTMLFIITENEVAAQGKNPCHRTKATTGEGQAECDRYVLPKKICLKCRLKPWNRINGDFLNCQSIYDVKEPACVNQLKKYVKRNPCDKKRAEQIQDLNNDDNVNGLDFFLYALCEQCCDCVPMGSNSNEFKTRKASGSLYKMDRGNCPAHANADICTIWPNVKAVGSKSSHVSNLPDDAVKICPLFQTWHTDVHNQGGWANKAEVAMAPVLNTFLTNLINSAGCNYKKTWKDCFKLEDDQGRLAL